MKSTVCWNINITNYGTITIRVQPLCDNAENIISCNTSIYCCYENGYDYIDSTSLWGLAQYSTRIAEMMYYLDKQGEFIEVNASSLEDLTTEITEIQSSDASNITVKGYISLTDNSGNVHPAESITVNIYDNNTYLGYATTNSNGYYSKSIPYTR